MKRFLLNCLQGISTFKAVCISGLLVLGFSQSLLAQNCTVNANINLPICANQALQLNGSASGLFDVPARWTQVSGPSVTITDPNSLTSNVTGYVAGNTYTFRLSARCADGSNISDDVVYTIRPVTLADAGEDVAGCPGTFPLSANAAGTNESGLWTIMGANNAGVTINSSSSPTTTITLATTSAGTTTLRWTITNTNSCSAHDDIIVSNSGGVMPVDAGATQNLGTCYTTTQSTFLNASFGGNIAAQRGTWTLVSGPNYPTFANIHQNNTEITGLIEGTYVLQWTVAGPCASGSDQVTINVAAATQGVTNATSNTVNYCNGTTEALLTGNVPAYSNETVSWVQTEGPAATIKFPNSPSTAIEGLDGSSNYTFRYTITGPNGCTSSSDSRIRYFVAPTMNAGPDQILGCGVNTVSIPLTFTGGSSSTWQIISGPSTTGVANVTGNPQVINTLFNAGTYTIRFARNTTGIGCANAFDDVNVTVSETPSASNAGTPQILGCNINQTNLAGNDPVVGAGFWSQVSGPNAAVITDHYNKDTQISGLIQGEYVFKWTISNGPLCPAEESTTSVRVSPPTPTTSIAGPDLAACAASPFIMTGNPVAAGETGLWTVSPTAGISFSDPTDNDAIVTGFAPNTTYTFTWTITNACGSDASSMDVTTGPLTGASVADAGINLCMAGGTASTTLAAVPPTAGTGTWSMISGPSTPGFTDVNDPASGINGLVNGTYILEWTVGLAGCQSNSDTMELTVSDAPVAAEAGADSFTVCGTTANLTGNVVAPSVGTWVLKSGPASVVIDDVNDPASLLTFADPGVYVFTWSIYAGACQSGVNEDDVTVYVSLPGTVANAHQSTAATIDVCNNNQVTLGANTPAAGEAGIWTIIGSSPNTPTITGLSNPNTTVTGMITGTYTFRWTISSGVYCTPSTSDVVVNVSTTVNAGADQNLCNQTQTTLTGNAGSSGTWTQIAGDAGPVLTPTGPYSVLVSDLDPTKQYTFRYTANAAFSCASAHDDVIVTGFPAPTIPDAGTDQEICTDATTSVMLTGNVPAVGTGSWSRLSGPNSPTINAGNAITVNGLIEGIYVFSWNITNGGCTTYFDVVRVTVYDPPTTSVAGVNQTDACQLTVTLNGNTPTKGIGTWSQVSGPGTATIDFPNQPVTTLSNLVAGTYRFQWTITNGTVCAPSSSVVDVTFTGAVPTTPDAGADQQLCAVTTATLDGNLVTTGTGTWSVAGPNTPAFSANTHNSTVTNLIPGTYTFTWTVVNGGCTLTDDVEITVYAAPSAAVAGSDASICPFETVTLSADAITSGTGAWTFVSGPSTPVINNPALPATTVNGTVPGVYVFKWTVTNGNCTANEDEVSITVNANCAPGIVDNTYTTLEDHVLTVPAISGILSNDTDPESQPLTVTTTPVTPPAHGSVVIQPDGSFVYTPDLDYNGSDSFTVSVCDNTPSCVNNVVDITITPLNDEPSFTKGSDQLHNVNAGAQIIATWATLITTGPADEAGQTLTFTVTNDNNPLFSVQPSIDPATGDLTYTPAANTTGVAIVTVILTDNGGTADGGDDTFATQTFTITVNPNDPPVADDHINTAVSSTAGAAPIDPLTATDADGTVQSYTIVSLPANGTLALNGTPVSAGQVLTPAEAGALTYDPDGDVNGDDTFTFTATDNHNAADATPATVTIPVLNNPPTADDHTNDPISTLAGATSIDPLTGSDTDGTLVSFTIVTLPPNGTLALSGTPSGTPVAPGQVLTPAEAAALTYTPDGTFNGNVSFTFTVTDNNTASDPTPATVIIPVNAPPVANDDADTTEEDVAVTITILGNDTDDVGVIASTVDLDPLTAGIQTTVITPEGTWTVNASGTVTFTPALHYNGTATIDYTVSDGMDAVSNVATITVTITPVNDPPVGQDDVHETIVGVPVSGEVLSDATDPENTTVTVNTSPVIPPQHGTILINPDGTYTYTPDPGFAGQDVIEVEVCDSGLPMPSLCSTLTITINVGVVPGKEIIIPEGFSPNDDGVNDYFVIQNHTGAKMKLEVFNRWGNVVYRNNNYQNDWGGIANSGVTIGEGLPDGTYYYVLEAGSFREVRYITIHR
jgi:gliding motility-associated-like protein